MRWLGLLFALLLSSVSSTAKAAGEVVAVFELESKGARLKSAALERLTDYVGAQLARAGYKVVPRQELKRALSQQKNDSYKACYAESCQIEVGKELAAEKTLAGTVSRLGSRCIVALKLIDLRTATQERAGTAKGKCTVDGVVDSTDVALKQLTGGAPATGSPALSSAAPKVSGADYGDLDAQVRAAADKAAKEEAARKSRELAARRDWKKIAPYVRGDKLPKKRRIATLEKFLATFDRDNPHADEAREALAALRVDGDMVLVPAGDFFMGCNERVDNECDDDEKPGRTVSVGAFAIDRTEVTVAAYEKCVAAGACTTSTFLRHSDNNEYCNYGNGARSDHPMNCVNWSGADAFCRWAKKRLPSEKEWEKAARGTDGRKYAWGNDAVDCRRAVLDDGRTTGAAGSETDGCGRDSTWPVGSKPEGASPYGAVDMIGNVWEWVADGYARDNDHSLRGGAWNFIPGFARASHRLRFVPSKPHDFVGFRCAQSR